MSPSLVPRRSRSWRSSGRGSRLGNYKGTMDHHRRLLAQLPFIALRQRRCSTAIPCVRLKLVSPFTDDQSQLRLRSHCRASSAGSAVITARTGRPIGVRATRVAQQPPWQVVGEARVGTALPGRRGGAHDPDRRPDLGNDRRARHLAADALSGVGDPQRPAEVADSRGEPSAAVERQQPGRLTRLAGVY